MKINEILNIKYPIFQGAMANISTAELAGAVSTAGGLGMIATGGFSPDEVRMEIRKIKKMTDKPFGVNLVMIHPDIEELNKVVVEEGVEIITCGAGNPQKYFDYWLKNKLKVIPIIANKKMAQKVESLGAIACVFEGAEAGGHIGKLNTFPALPEICDSVKIPVISAGGIYTARHILAAEILGASGVQMGTKFLLSREAPVHEKFKEVLIEAKDRDTIVTGVTTNHPIRCYKNKLAEKLLEIEINNLGEEEFEKYARGSGKKAVRDGDVEWGSVLAGEGFEYLNKIESAREIIENIMKEYEKLKRSFKEKY
ncbi:enoyl-[acyl-carrier-protein] reductase FabK [Peptoniphilus sp. AGMB00490]|uniref:Probable nitronate monooxygenase n=1 Tax=Peptoniphilus faecalis TaxID=2731255 RepID=A0A848RG05_9FIRM|nr:nitronate monooxygenase [Peptoniphilus faecalis]NMW85750.1 enoyl-[acyl-carrier-protein] reductase FabK [Peptoniphilus faecalis]